MDYKKLKKELLKDKVVRKEYERADLAFEVAKMIIRLRSFKGLTQEKLARLMKTKQPSLARVESGQHLPSLSFLNNVAEAAGTSLTPPGFACLEAMDVDEIVYETLPERSYEDADVRLNESNLNSYAKVGSFTNSIRFAPAYA